MTDASFSVFKRFMTVAEAEDVAQPLDAQGIPVRIEDQTHSLDSTFVGHTMQPYVELRIPAHRFEEARQVLAQEAEALIDGVDLSYYLFSFSNEELYEVILKPDEWNEFDVQLAQEILAQRGQHLDPELIQAMRKQRIETLAQPSPRQQSWVAAGYLFTLLGGLLGLIIGWYLWKAQKTLPNGKKVYLHQAEDRRHGKIILLLGLAMLPVIIWLRMQVMG